MAVPWTFAQQSGQVPALQLDQNFNACLTVPGHAGSSVIGNPTGGAGNAVDIGMSTLVSMLHPSLIWECVGFLGGVQGGGNWFLIRYTTSSGLQIVQSMCYASANVAATNQAVFPIIAPAGEIGYVVFPAGSGNGQVNISGGSYGIGGPASIACYGPNPADPTLADISVTIGGHRI